MQVADVPVCLIIAVDGGEFSMFPWGFRVVIKQKNEKMPQDTESNATNTEIARRCWGHFALVTAGDVCRKFSSQNCH